MASTPGLAQELEALSTAARQVQISRYVDVASYVAMVYDILITMTEERELFWKREWTNGKLLFFAVRYPAAIEGIIWLVYEVANFNNPKFCEVEVEIGSWATLVFLIPLQIVVILRTVALWDRNKKIIVLLICTAVAVDVTMAVTLVRVSKFIHLFPDQPFVPFLGCDSGQISLSPMITVPVWVALIVFDTLIFALTLIRALRSHRFFRTRLLVILFRDGFLFYTVMLAISVANLLLFLKLPATSALRPVLTPVVRACYSVTGSRILLNMRGALDGSRGEDTDYAAASSAYAAYPSASLGGASARGDMVPMATFSPRARGRWSHQTKLEKPNLYRTDDIGAAY